MTIPVELEHSQNGDDLHKGSVWKWTDYMSRRTEIERGSTGTVVIDGTADSLADECSSQRQFESIITERSASILNIFIVGSRGNEHRSYDVG